MTAATTADVLRPALMLLAHYSDRRAGADLTDCGHLDKAYAAARLVFPIVRFDVGLWAPEIEDSALGRGVMAGRWCRDDVEPGCVIVGLEEVVWQCPDGVSASSAMGIFAGLAASIIAACLVRDDALRASMIAEAAAGARVALATYRADSMTVHRADLVAMLPETAVSRG